MTGHDTSDPGGDRALARKLGQAREELELREGRYLLGAADEAQRWLEAAALAGIAVAALDLPAGSADTASAVDARRDTGRPRRVTATVRGLDDRPLERDHYASHLQAQMDLGRGGQRRPLLTDEEGQAVAALLDELAGVYPREDLGRLARELAVRINDRLGI
ncbi:hypothetical protein SAMN05443575_1603 [Jatrophihabitans endophyticus]|uniref:Uncharacterized protein n=1 Tax=Jatrophihabitans endophyticus TaxID=1206085 RepID=A0A1M5HQK9_9ACTN|nr:hypothetical protein [Jatrophihabitans endophyticus]SHG18249.1 hypothetical protein SAMN05443575_1603 [Jatrophihabitans endophyticus]